MPSVEKEKNIANLFNDIEKEIFGPNDYVNVNELTLLRHIRLMVPVDFLDKNLQNPESLSLLEQISLRLSGESHLDYLAKRQKDVLAMTDRVELLINKSMEQLNPSSSRQNEGLTQDLLQNPQLQKIKEYFISLHQKYTAPITTVSQETVDVKAPQQPIAMNRGQPKEEGNAANAQNTSSTQNTSSSSTQPVTNTYSGVCCIGMEACANVCCIPLQIMGNSAQQHNEALGTTAAVNGEGPPNSVGEVLTGQWGAYWNAECNESMYNGCENLFGHGMANIFCCGYQQDQGTAAAMNGDSAPHGLCAGWAFESTRCNESFYHCWTSACYDMCHPIVNFCGALPSHVGNCATDGCHDLGQIANVLGSGCHEVSGIIQGCLNPGELCNLISQCCQCCQSNGRNNDDCEACGQIFGVISAIVGSIVGGIKASPDKKDSAKHLRYLLENQTAAEYTPSIVIMSVALAILFPNISAELVKTLKQIQEGIAVEQNIRLLQAQFIVALPVALAMSYAGGASYWTYTTLTLSSMSMSNLLMDYYHNKVNGKLSTTAYLSAAEWRDIPESKQTCNDLEQIATKLLKNHDELQTETDRLKNLNCLTRMAKPIYAALFKAQALYNKSDEIKASREALKYKST